jgi:HTH-type transcriptional regulator/antitoxin HigA
VQEIKKAPWNGATRWLAPEKVMIILNIRGKTEDKFWFSFFHEAGHVLNDKRLWVYINNDKGADAYERQADEFAAETLIPRSWDDAISRINTNAEVIELAAEIGVSPGIVAGRFQHLTGKWDFFNVHKNKFTWKRAE